MIVITPLLILFLRVRSIPLRWKTGPGVLLDFIAVVGPVTQAGGEGVCSRAGGWSAGLFDMPLWAAPGG